MSGSKPNANKFRCAEASLRSVRVRGANRSGWVLMVALVAIGVFLGISTVGIRWMLRSRQEMRVDRDLIQVGLLIDAGISRAMSSYSADREYRGELWLEQFEVGSGRRMRVEIRENAGDVVLPQVDKVDEKGFEIVVRMERQDQTPNSIQRTKRITLSR